MTRERIRILLIDDNETDAWIARSLLGECGNFEVVHVQRFEDAADRIAGSRIDAILFDPKLAGAGSLEGAVRFLHAHGFDAPIIVFSRLAGADPLAAREAVRAGADDLLPKAPVDGGTIRRTIFAAIERTRRERVRLAEVRAAVTAAKEIALLPPPEIASVAEPEPAAA